MATLNFKGKNIIWNHHLSVPYHTLETDDKLSYKPDKADGNLIIEGDNLLAMKSLLPQYSGKIKCIYIDPPYNTGNEGWVYNDNVNSPLLKEWIGKEVGTDDLTRHDKWLTMMTPRIKLMRDILADDGVVFISIDDNEVHNLRLLMNDVFGEDNFITSLIWEKKTGASDAKTISTITEYVLVYTKYQPDKENQFNNNMQSYDLNRYKYKDKHFDVRGPFYIDNLDRGGLRYSDNLNYEIEAPDGLKTYPNGRIIFENDGWTWKWGREKLKWGIENDFIVFKKSRNKSSGVGVYYKNYLKVDNENNPIERSAPRKNLIRGVINANGATDIKSLFGNKAFSYPKPVEFIKEVLRYYNCQNEYILDCFAGSGTTAQAVLELNEEDEGGRKFIMIQMPESSKKEPKKNICKDITRERVVKVIEKKLKNKDVGLEYMRVGQPIDAETILSGQFPSFEDLAKYVFYLATGQTPKKKDINQKSYLAGRIDNTEVYLMYEPDMEKLKTLAITFDWAKKVSNENNSKKIVYAPACFLEDEYLSQFNIRFVSIPYNLFERQE